MPLVRRACLRDSADGPRPALARRTSGHCAPYEPHGGHISEYRTARARRPQAERPADLLLGVEEAAAVRNASIDWSVLNCNDSGIVPNDDSRYVILVPALAAVARFGIDARRRAVTHFGLRLSRHDDDAASTLAHELVSAHRRCLSPLRR